jgi:serine/threonine-protein kinase
LSARGPQEPPGAPPPASPRSAGGSGDAEVRPPGAPLLVGPYEIIKEIGRGGMGVVWLARDPRLDRFVAIKSLAPEFARDAERVGRFEREARSLAAVSHPNIATAFGLREDGEARFLIMEYVEGESLARRLRRGGLSVEEALELAQQVAAGLAAAHSHGIIHRDVKPANILIDKEDRVKLVDFGLARDPESQQRPDGLAGTLKMDGALTRDGIVVGTPQYMSPEQARGRPVDTRTDVFSFGSVLFECLSGVPAFPGETASDVMAALLEREPRWELLPERTPSRVRELLEDCLRKELHHRLRDLGDAAHTLERAISGREWLLAGEAPPTPKPALTAGGAPRTFSRLPSLPDAAIAEAPASRLGLGLALGSVLGALLALLLGRALLPGGGGRGGAGGMTPAGAGVAGVPGGVARLALILPPEQAIPAAFARPLAVSPDGAALAFVAGNPRRIWIRKLSDSDAVPLAGTEGATDPFFSPDGQWIGFLTAPDGRVHKVPLAGGAVSTVSPKATVAGAAFGPDGTLYASDADLRGAIPDRVAIVATPREGGEPRRITVPGKDAKDAWHYFPEPLPDGHTLLFTSSSRPLPHHDAGGLRIEAQRLDSGERRTLIEGVSRARFVPTGHLVYDRWGTVYAAPFDIERMEITGPEVAVLRGVRRHDETHTAHFAFSQTGTLIWVAGSSGLEQKRSISLVNPDGTATRLPAEPGSILEPRAAPDGGRVAFSRSEGEGRTQIWMMDVLRGTLSRLTFGTDDQSPVWAPDGASLFYRAGSSLGEDCRLYRVAAEGGSPEMLTTFPSRVGVEGVSPDGKRLLYSIRGAGGNDDLWTVELSAAALRRPAVATPALEAEGAPSPDGRWLAFSADDAGRREVYVTSTSRDGFGRYRVSTQGGNSPRWSRDGRTLFFRNERQVLAANVALAADGGFGAGEPRLLFEGDWELGGWDVLPDGRFVMVRNEEEPSGATAVQVLLGWFADLERQVPGAR